MQPRIFHRILAVLLSAVFLIGNLGFSLSTHFCCGEAVESKLALLPVEIGCGMAEEEPAAPCPSDGPLIQSKSCCADHIQHFQVDEANSNPIALPLPYMAIGLLQVQSFSFVPALLKLVPSKSILIRPPPLSKAPLFQLFQSFRL